MKLVPPRHSSDAFRWSRWGKLGVADLSDFNRSLLADRLYDDSCDVGFEIESERTGKVLLFTYVMSHKDGDGDITHDEYLSTTEGIKIVVFNT